MIGIRLYRDHCASKCAQTALPQDSARGHTGRAVAYNDVITVPPRHHEHQTQARPATSCSPSTPDHYPQVLNLNASEHHVTDAYWQA